ncbi:hypothetical protein DFJ73DRAFT_796704 [Zopfochytrium polystomum]|nr:hypothetical protein DFJ73DRAFT_796704 [Zopfochytrium polystomum]
MEVAEVPPLLDITPDGQEIPDPILSSEERLAASLLRIDIGDVRRRAKDGSKRRKGKRRKRPKTNDPTVGTGGSDDDDIPKQDPIIAMKDRVYYAKEELAVAIDVLSRILGQWPTATAPQPPAAPLPAGKQPLRGRPQPPPPQPPPPSIPPPPQLLRMEPIQFAQITGPVKRIEAIHDVLASKKDHLLEVAGRLRDASVRLDAAQERESRFYDVAMLLRREGWILQSRELTAVFPSQTILYVDYGLRGAGSMFSEICEATFPWDALVPADSSANEIANPEGSVDVPCDLVHKNMRKLRISCNSPIATTAESHDQFQSFALTERFRFAESPLLRQLLTAQNAAFEAEMFAELDLGDFALHVSLETQTASRSRRPSTAHAAPHTVPATRSATPPDAFLEVLARLALRRIHRKRWAQFTRRSTEAAPARFFDAAGAAAKPTASSAQAVGVLGTVVRFAQASRLRRGIQEAIDRAVGALLTVPGEVYVETMALERPLCVQDVKSLEQVVLQEMLLARGS